MFLLSTIDVISSVYYNFGKGRMSRGSERGGKVGGKLTLLDLFS